MSEPQKKRRFNLPRDFDAVDRAKAATLIRDKIIARTDKGVDSEGQKFAGYSETYVNSLEFKIAGKSKNEVNLQLSGDMLNSIQVIGEGPGYVTLGFDEGTPENDKAVWAERSDNGPSRKFLGLTEAELELIIAEIRTDRPRNLNALVNEEYAVTAGKNVTNSVINNILNQLLARFGS